MGLFDFLFGSSEQQKAAPSTQSSFPVSKAEMQQAQSIAKKLDRIFWTSPALKALDNRNNVMHSRMLSYRSMLAFIYENDYGYGSCEEYIDASEMSHYALVVSAMSDKAHRNMSVAQLSTNWRDVLQVVNALNMAEPERMQPINADVNKLTSIINRIK